jgi:hypothetical protein
MGATDQTLITIPLGFHKTKVSEASTTGMIVGGFGGGMITATVIGFIWLISHAFSGGPMPKEEVVFTGVLEKAHEFYTYPPEVQLHFAGKQEFAATINKVPYYVGEYQELVCEKDKDGHLTMIRNSRPQHKENER